MFNVYSSFWPIFVNFLCISSWLPDRNVTTLQILLGQIKVKKEKNYKDGVKRLKINNFGFKLDKILRRPCEPCSEGGRKNISP